MTTITMNLNVLERKIKNLLKDKGLKPLSFNKNVKAEKNHLRLLFNTCCIEQASQDCDLPERGSIEILWRSRSPELKLANLGHFYKVTLQHSDWRGNYAGKDEFILLPA